MRTATEMLQNSHTLESPTELLNSVYEDPTLFKLESLRGEVQQLSFLKDLEVILLYTLGWELLKGFLPVLTKDNKNCLAL